MNKTRKQATVKPIKSTEALKVSEVHLSKIKEIQAKEQEAIKLAPIVCTKEFELNKFKAHLETLEKDYLESKEKLNGIYTDIAISGDAINKELGETYGNIQFTDVEKGEYIIN